VSRAPRTILFAPDSFKGSLSSVDVARALADGWRRGRPDDRILFAPLADGGEGTLEAIAAAGGWTTETVEVLNPDHVPTRARWLKLNDDDHAIVELAQASGLSLLNPEDRNPSILTTYGTGQLLTCAIDAGVRRITLGIGGSATNDGGCGLLQALGARPLDEDGKVPVEEPTPTIPILLDDVQSVDLAGLDARLSQVDLEVACDVTNPLLGPEGATATYGPQKGLIGDDMALLEGALEAWADALEAATGRRERDTPGAGAAGGVGFGLLCMQDRFRSFALRPGVELVMEATGFADKLATSDLVVTGEGRIDAQTAYGKTALGVARRASDAGVPCIAVGGGVTPEGIAALAELRAVVVPVVERPMTVDEAMATGMDPLVRMGERLSRLIGLAS
jgi:glycerate kinase